jgi:hypothetical protein
MAFFPIPRKTMLINFLSKSKAVAEGQAFHGATSRAYVEGSGGAVTAIGIIAGSVYG